MQSSPASRHFLPLKYKHSPQHPVLKHPQSMFFPECERPSSHQYKTRSKISFVKCPIC
jgi:hypothetical protein